MKNFFYTLLFLLYVSFLFSSDFNIFLRFSAAGSKNTYFSREITIENNHNCKNCPLRCLFLFSHESFDNILWGTTNRFSFKCPLLFGEKNNLLMKIGTGLSLASSYDVFSFSPDIYLKLYYRIFFIFLDTSFYSDGIFNKNGAGVEFKIWEILFDAGINNIIVSDYEYSLFKLRFEIGAGYEF